MKRIFTCSCLAAILLCCARFAPLRAQDNPEDKDDKPKVLVADLTEKQVGEWTFVAVANHRKVGRLTIKVIKDEDNTRPRLQEIEERACAFGKMTCTRDYTNDRGIEYSVMVSKMEAKLGAYSYSDEFTLTPDTFGKLSGKARIQAGRIFDYEFETPPPSEKDPTLEGVNLKTPFSMMGNVRLLTRLVSDQPGYARRMILIDISEPRAKASAVGADLALDGTEELTVLGKKQMCNKLTLKNGADVIGEYWLDPKHWVIEQFSEKSYIHGNPIETKYTRATPEEAQAAMDEAAKWGAGNKDPETLALAWLKEVLKGDAAAAAKLTDQTAVDALLTQYAEPALSKVKAALALPALTKMFKETPSEQIFRYVFVLRDDPKGGVNVYLPTVDGNCILHLTKGADAAAPDAWKVTGITPPL